MIFYSQKKTIKLLSILIYENCMLVGEVIFRVLINGLQNEVHQNRQTAMYGHV